MTVIRTEEKSGDWRNRILFADCLQVMRDLPDQSVDMVLCDLPYGATGLKWDQALPMQQLWQHYRRVVKDKGAILLFGTEPFASRVRLSNFDWYKYDWTWVKSDATDCMNAKHRPMRKTEKIIVFSSGTTANGSTRRMPYFPQGLVACDKARAGNDYGATGGSFKRYRPSHGPYRQQWTNYPTDVLYFPKDKDRYVPTQKPVALCEYLIKTYTEQGALVLDHCGGSGTTAIACINAGRDFLIVEKDPVFYNIAHDRIQRHWLRQVAAGIAPDAMTRGEAA